MWCWHYHTFSLSFCRTWCWLLVPLRDGRRLHGHSVLCATNQESLLSFGYMRSHKTKNKTIRKGNSLLECLWGATACWAILNTAYTVKRFILIVCWNKGLLGFAANGMQEVDVSSDFKPLTSVQRMKYPLPAGMSMKVFAMILVQDSFVTSELHKKAPNPSQSLWGWMKRKFSNPMPTGINHIQTAWECCIY